MTLWPAVALGDIVELKYGRALKADERRSGEFLVMGSNGAVGHHDSGFTVGPTIVVGRKGSVGALAYSEGPCWPIDTAYYVDSTTTQQDLRWLYWAIGQLGLKEMNKAAAVPGLNREDAYRVTLPLPPLREQRRIASILDQADSLRAKRMDLIAIASKLKAAAFDQIFDLDPAKANAVLSERIDPMRPLTYGILMPGPHIEGGVPYIRVTDIQNGAIRAETVRSTTPEISAEYSRSVLAAGDVLMSIRGHVGRTAVVPTAFSGANITQDTARIALMGLSSAFLREWLATPAIQTWMAQRTKGVAVRGINLGDVKNIPICVPSSTDEARFGGASEVIDQFIALHSQALDREVELFASLQHRAFTGQL